jgi:hypothetical protein
LSNAKLFRFANKDDKCTHFILCNHIPNLVILLHFSLLILFNNFQVVYYFTLIFKLLLVSETNKIYVLAVDKGKLVCELENKQNLVFIEPNTNQVSCTFASKDEFVFLKGFENESKQNGQLVCHSLRLISILDEYFYSASNRPAFNHCLPQNATLSERMKILLKNRIEEQANRKERLKLAWSSLSKTSKQIAV